MEAHRDIIKRILVVDDNRNELLVLSTILQRMGNCQVVAAASAQEALRKAEREQFDLLVTDIWMPQMDGTRLTEAFLELTPQAAVIWMTGAGCHIVDDSAHRLGIKRCLDKPVPIQQIRHAVRNVLAN